MKQNGASYELVPSSGWLQILLVILFFYVFFRHIMFSFMIADVILTFFKQFRWFPSKGKRLRTFVHWLIAIALMVGTVIVASNLGYLEIVRIR